MNEAWWARHRQFIAEAHSRPEALIGPRESGHRMLLSQAVRLVLKSGVFEGSPRVVLKVSPHQYVFRGNAGPLRRTVERHFTWRAKLILYEDWMAQNRVIVEACDRLLDQEESKTIPAWMQYLGGATGPTLYSPIWPLVLATRHFFGIRTHSGTWCQGFHNGLPVSSPENRDTYGATSFVVAAELDPQVFLGLPFTPEDVAVLNRDSRIAATFVDSDTLVSEESVTRPHYASWFDEVSDQSTGAIQSL